MIFVTVGTQKFPMDRLMREIDEMIKDGRINEPVFAQLGYSKYIPKNYKYVDFLSNRDFDDCIDNCDVLVTHSGVATIIKGIKKEKPVIVVPRLKKYGEHVDDHQLEIALTFYRQNLVLICEDEVKLGQLIVTCKYHKFAKYKSETNKIITSIQNFLDTF